MGFGFIKIGKKKGFCEAGVVGPFFSWLKLVQTCPTSGAEAGGSRIHITAAPAGPSLALSLRSRSTKV